MSAEAIKRVSPIVGIAAASVIVFSAVGVGVLTGVIPSSWSTTRISTIEEVNAPSAADPRTHSAASRSENRVASSSSTRRASSEPRAPVRVASAPPAPVAAAPAPAAPVEPVTVAPVVPVAPICISCGVVEAVEVINKRGEPTAIGMVGGAVVGGLLGTQIGGGRGKTIATVAGAAGGALAGREVEARMKADKDYKVNVRMDDGERRAFDFPDAPGFVVGEKVRVVDGRLVRS